MGAEKGSDKQVIMLVKSDPEVSHRPVEAIRIALGLISGEHEVQVILLGKAPLLLGEDAEDLVDGEELAKYIPTLQDLGLTFWVEQEALKRAGIEASGYKIKSVSMEEISTRIAQSERHIVF